MRIINKKGSNNSTSTESSVFYECIFCKYKTGRKYNFKKHLVTQKHERKKLELKVSKNGKKVTKNGKKVLKNGQKSSKSNYTCKYCEKLYASKRNCKRHLRTCDMKLKHEVENIYTKERKKMRKIIMKYKKISLKKEETILTLKKEHSNCFKKEKMYIREKQQLLKINEKLQNDLNRERANLSEINKEYNDYIKSNKEIITNKHITNNNITYLYIVTKFTEPYDFMQLLKPPITEEELDDNLCITFENILYGRCINNIDVRKRPIHCTDVTRKNFSLYIDNCWRLDYSGKDIFTAIFEKIRKLYPNKTPNEIMKVLELQKNREKLMKYVSQITSTRNLNAELLKNRKNKCTNNKLVIGQNNIKNVVKSKLEISEESMSQSSEDEIESSCESNHFTEIFIKACERDKYLENITFNDNY